jgi:hypothetical protein
MKLIITLLAIATLSACASKKTAEAPAKTETPATVAAEKSAADAKKDDKSKKSAKKETKTETAQTAATSTGAVGTAEVTCKSGSDERKLAINVKGSGCELAYTKAGETKSIASQINGSEKCEEVMTSVKEKLVAANYACQ